MAKKKQYQSGRGLDVGTANLVASKMAEDGEIEITSVRNAFLDIPDDNYTKKMLGSQNIPYIKRSNKLYVVGEDAFELANVFNKETRRPMKRGMITPTDVDAMPMEIELLKSILGDPIEKGEMVYYSIPADPIDSTMNIVYHENVICGILEKLGYTGKSLNEGHAVSFAELADDEFSGISVSCLTPGNKVYTKRSLVNIEDIQVGDYVLSKNGKWNEVENVIINEKDEEVIKFDILGTGFGLEVTKDHKIYILRDGLWEWVKAEDVVVGDIVGEPILNRSTKQNYISFKDRIGNNKRFNKTVHLSYNVCKWLGYWMADGSINSDKGYVQFDFGPKELKFADDIEKISQKCFHRPAFEVSVATRNNIRQRISYTALSKWLKRKCYIDGNKYIPFDIETFNVPQIIGFVQGMLFGDGYIPPHRKNSGSITFENTSIYLCKALHQMLGMLHINSSFYCRDRTNESSYIAGNYIKSKKKSYTISVSGFDLDKLYTILKYNEASNLQFLMGGYRCGKIGNITTRHYKGPVYDLTVANDHSFTLPGIVVHNCGGGMVNVCVTFKSIPVISFATSKGGDWIDQQAAQVMGVATSKMTAIKEKGMDLSNPSSPEEEAIAIYYRNLIKYSLTKIVEKFQEIEAPNFPNPIPIVASGGTSLISGFIEVFQSEFDKLKNSFPIEIKEIRHAEDPLNATSKGCLLASLSGS